MNAKKIVTIGGGSGGFTLLRGLRDYPVDITAICTVFDSGGSTGVLRDEYGALPQGDVRRCLLALLPDEASDWRRLLMHRFDKSGSLSDHALGNLLLFAAEKEWGRLGGIKQLCKLLGARGMVLPVSVDSAHLVAELSDGTRVNTESAIDTRNVLSDDRSIKRVWLDAPATATRDALDAITSADFIILGPGDLYTSIIPNLLVNGVVEAINASHAKLIYVSNLMTKGAETRDYQVVDFVKALASYGVRKFDFVLASSDTAPPALMLAYAAKERATPLLLNSANANSLSGYAHRIVTRPLVSQRGVDEELVRHSSRRTARSIMSIVEGDADIALVVDLDDTLCETTRCLQGEATAVERLELAPGAEDFLASFSGKKILLTAGDEPWQNAKLSHLGIEKYFDRIVIVPLPEDKQSAMFELFEDEALNLVPVRTLVVGDRMEYEIAYAKAHGAVPVVMILPNGKYATKQVAGVRSFKELSQLVLSFDVEK